MSQCTISDAWTYHDMRVVWMENDLIKIGLLVGRGADIFEFRHKEKNLNFLLKLSKDILNPNHSFSQMRNTHSQMEDYYYGGWQECLPNSAPINYRGASLGQHGEVWMIPWKHAILKDSPSEVSVKVWTSPLRVPLHIEKTLTITADQSTLFISESLTNTSSTDLDIMWGHHIAFGLPFLKEGGHINTNARTIHVEQTMPAPRKWRGGSKSPWPNVMLHDGSEGVADIIPPANKDPYSDLAYLSEFEDQAQYTIKNPSTQMEFSVKWDASLFKYLWLWQERFATKDAPWWGDAYAIGLEPWTSPFSSDPHSDVAQDELLKIRANETIKTKLQASVNFVS